MSTTEQDQVLAQEIEVLEDMGGQEQLVVWLKELQRRREVAAEMTVIGYVAVKAYRRLEEGHSRFCVLYPAEHVRGHHRSRRPDGCVAVYARCEKGSAA